MFEGLADEDVLALGHSLVERRFPAGYMIMNQGDPGTAMYIIASGHVNIHLPGEGVAAHLPLKDVTDGEYLGELARCSTHKPRSASAVAT